MDNETDIILEVFGAAYKDSVLVRNVPILMRTLYDEEMLECLKRASEHSDPIVHDFVLKRWHLAFAIENIADTKLGDFPEDKFEKILKLPEPVVNAIYDCYQRMWIKEMQVLGVLGEFTEVASPKNENA